MVAPATTISVTISLITVLKLYDIITVLTSGGPAYATESTAQYIVKLAFTSDRFGYASAIAMVCCWSSPRSSRCPSPACSAAGRSTCDRRTTSHRAVTRRRRRRPRPTPAPTARAAGSPRPLRLTIGDPA